MFSTICNPDNMSLQLGPLEYLEALRREPRVMAILRAVQDEMRVKLAPKKEPKKGADDGRDRPT